MSNRQLLALIRALHTAIYLAMAASTFVLVYAGVTGAQGLWLWIALVLLLIESMVYLGNGMKCPTKGSAVRYGAEKGYIFDTFLPERATRYTFIFTIIIWALGFVHKPHGPQVFLLLFVVLILVGGGVGQVLFFIMAYGAGEIAD